MGPWPIGAHYCRHRYAEARDLGLSFTWLHADGLTGDPRSVALHDASGLLESGLRYVLVFNLRRDGIVFDGEAWRAYVRATWTRLQELGALDRCSAVQLDDEFYTWAWEHGFDLDEIARFVARRADEARAIFGPRMGLGVGMAETGALAPPNVGIDWWGLNVYLAAGYYTDAGQVAAIYGAAARLGRPLMPILPVFADRGASPVPLEQLAACYLPLLERHAAQIAAVGVFCLRHPSQDEPGLHPEGRGVLDLPAPYAAGVRYLTSVYGASLFVDTV